MLVYDEHWALEQAIKAGATAQCQKSQRGVIIWNRLTGNFVVGSNAPPLPFKCTNTDLCRENCNKLAVHAEQAAIIAAGSMGLFINQNFLEMLHVKVVDGLAVSSGQPSCWHCSKLILSSPIKSMWLLHDSGLKQYSTIDFHQLTLKYHNLQS